MIQRIQSVYLFLAAIVTAITLYFNYYKLGDGTLLNLQNNYIGIILAGLASVVSLVTLFNFKKRKAQLNLIWLNILIIIGLLIWMFISINQAIEANSSLISTSEGSYQVGAFIPVISIILLFLARTGIRKDIKLLKAYDRLR